MNRQDVSMVGIQDAPCLGAKMVYTLRERIRRKLHPKYDRSVAALLEEPFSAKSY